MGYRVSLGLGVILVLAMCNSGSGIELQSLTLKCVDKQTKLLGKDDVYLQFIVDGNVIEFDPIQGPNGIHEKRFKKFDEGDVWAVQDVVLKKVGKFNSLTINVFEVDGTTSDKLGTSGAINMIGTIPKITITDQSKYTYELDCVTK